MVYKEMKYYNFDYFHNLKNNNLHKKIFIYHYITSDKNVVQNVYTYKHDVITIFKIIG
jgi:hypothetical protein